jgi:hypothetical protein
VPGDVTMEREPADSANDHMRSPLRSKAPVPGRQEAHEFWTGSEVLVWGGGVPVGNSCCKTVKPGYGYTP